MTPGGWSLSALLELGTGYGAVTIKHPCHRTAGGEWDALARLRRRHLNVLTGARILTPWGLPPDVAAKEIGARLHRVDMTPDELADWLLVVAVPAIAEARTQRQAASRRKRALRQGEPTYYALRNTQARQQGYKSLWYKRRALWADAPPLVCAA